MSAAEPWPRAPVVPVASAGTAVREAPAEWVVLPDCLEPAVLQALMDRPAPSVRSHLAVRAGAVAPAGSVARAVAAALPFTVPPLVLAAQAGPAVPVQPVGSAELAALLEASAQSAALAPPAARVASAQKRPFWDSD
ncbi:hypothetical protein LAUMK13_01976 [Mycobacterium innocens]|uniref:Uncharacterized protein n=1 Tax=Mycobacterium innocens TaxID=2341083 RepID=A0A498Q1C4_9MYCO|nr:hypothetical protein [Mycobacterium kansasii]VBA38115.1 hypothetical protein LAUMK13_01976 [Mycobacterium innocens]